MTYRVVRFERWDERVLEWGRLRVRACVFVGGEGIEGGREVGGVTLDMAVCEIDQVGGMGAP